MAAQLLTNLLGTYSEKVVHRHRKRVALINNLEPEMQKLSNADLAHQSVAFKQRLANGEPIQQLLPEAFAVVREAAIRTIGKRHFEVQLIGGLVLHEGSIAEMKTGEGKTLVATLPLYLNSLSGLGAHLVTVNDYLARVGCEEMGRVYRFLGMSTGLIKADSTPEQRRAAYACDITYGTNNEIGFDYLRDNMALYPDELVQRHFHYAIIDEVDSILIDEAQTPLILSGPSGKPTRLYQRYAELVKKMKRDEDYIVDEKDRRTALTEIGISKVEKWLDIENLYIGTNHQFSHFINNALKAKELYQNGREYIVQNGEVIIVDEFTGRLMFGRRWSDGLHQAVEAKEKVAIEEESQTHATVTLQNFFRMYRRLAGMTGTAMTEQEEFRRIYGLDCIEIPTHLPMIRKELPDSVYKTTRARFNAVANAIVERNLRGQPVLVGTVSVAKSEYLSEILTRRGIKHQVLNAKQHEREAEIIAQAGRLGAVTIATNMAGRGTDILLGGNPEFLAKERLRAEGISPGLIAAASDLNLTASTQLLAVREKYQHYLAEALDQCAREHERVKATGGLFVIGSERHEARRIDNQLRGRSGRQGDPGESRFYAALEDDLMRLFGGSEASNWLGRLGADEEMPIENPVLSRLIEKAQKKVEARNFEIRKEVLNYDQAMNQQRELIYRDRRRLLEGEDTRATVLYALEVLANQVISRAVEPGVYFEEWDPQLLVTLCEDAGIPQGSLCLPELKAAVSGFIAVSAGKEKLAAAVTIAATRTYELREALISPQVMRQLERFILLRMLDEKWTEHLVEMEELRLGIGLRAHGQKDPLTEYTLEAIELFNEMISRIQAETVKQLFALKAPEPGSRRASPQSGRGRGSAANQARSPKRVEPAWRHDPCPCESGKKFRLCHGRE